MRTAAWAVGLIAILSGAAALAAPTPAPVPAPGSQKAYVHIFRARGSAGGWVKAVVTLDKGLAFRMGENDCTVMHVDAGAHELLVGWGEPGPPAGAVYDEFRAEPGRSYYYRYVSHLGQCAGNCMAFRYELTPVTAEQFQRDARKCKPRLAEAWADAFRPAGGYPLKR